MTAPSARNGEATTECPKDAAEVAAAIAAAAAAHEPMSVVGNASKEPMLRPTQAARTLSVHNLTGITLHSPSELVLSAHAGTPLATIETALAEHDQHLIAEPPDLREILGTTGAPTLGGTVAANLSGPRRVAQGAMRDHVLGLRAITGEGVPIHSGGRVLKNVTGLDLCKLFAGSFGTLGVITEITLKVLPRPECSASVAIAGLDPAAGVAALSAALGSPYGVSGAAYFPEAAAARIAPLAKLRPGVAVVRIEELASSVAYRTERLQSELGRFGATSIIPEAVSRGLWREVRDVHPLPLRSDDAIWRISVRPSAAVRVIEAIDAAQGSWFLDWGGGLIWVAAAPEASVHERITNAVKQAGGVWMLLRAPAALRASVAVVPPLSPVFARLTKRMKEAFDPQGILNFGRMYAGI